MLPLVALSFASCEKDNGNDGNPAQKLVKEITSRGDGYTESWAYEYDAQNRIVKVIETYSESDYHEKVEHTIEYDGNTITIASYNALNERYTFRPSLSSFPARTGALLSAYHRPAAAVNQIAAHGNNTPRAPCRPVSPERPAGGRLRAYSGSASARAYRAVCGRKGLRETGRHPSAVPAFPEQRAHVKEELLRRRPFFRQAAGLPSAARIPPAGGHRPPGCRVWPALRLSSRKGRGGASRQARCRGRSLRA